MMAKIWWSSNLSFTAKFRKHKPLILLEKVGALWFLASEKKAIWDWRTVLVREMLCGKRCVGDEPTALDYAVKEPRSRTIPCQTVLNPTSPRQML